MLLAFHLGRVYTLSLAEIIAVFNQTGVKYNIRELFTEVLVLETSQDLDLPSLQKRLGGVVKIMEVVEIIERKKSSDYLSFTIKDFFTAELLKKHYLKDYAGKIQFGISIYPLTPKQNKFVGQNKRIGMLIKKMLQTAGLSCRLVLPEGRALALPSVAVTNNHVLEKGAEIVFIASEKKIYVGKTATVQDFADYGRRDYQRPARDARVGMLPPKVAQIMINLAQISSEAKKQGKAVLDPFCGVGTVLQEALLFGFKVIGSDISSKAIEDAEKNLNWFRIRYKLPPGRFQLIQSDVQELDKNLPNKNIAAVVSEGTLGPAYLEPPTEKEVEKNFRELSKLYLNAFKQIKKLLQPNDRVVFALPAYRRKNGYICFPVVDKILEIGYDIVAPLPEELLKKYEFLKVTSRKSIIYDRKDQIVVREIIIFKVK